MQLQAQTDDIAALLEASSILALHAQKDMSWKRTLAGPDRDKAIAAYEKERVALCKTILTPITPEDHDYYTAVAEATAGRFLLDVKRDGSYKVSGVKQGFKEDKTTADGPDFNYYAHVAKLLTVRSTLFRPNRGTRRIAIKDVSTAFLQSFGYDGRRLREICFIQMPHYQS